MKILRADIAKALKYIESQNSVYKIEVYQDHASETLVLEFFDDSNVQTTIKLFDADDQRRTASISKTEKL